MKLWMTLLPLTLAPAAVSAAGPIGIADNDRVVFYGDKLVDPPGFGFMVESFVRVKYPDSKARFWHVGRNRYGRVEQANEEFDARVAALQPTIVVLCWGLGDGEMSRYDPAREAKVTSEYELLLDRCRKIGAQVYVVTPPCPTVAKKNRLSIARYDETVMHIAEAIKAVAVAKGVPVLDWYALTAPAQKEGKGQHLTDKDGLFPTGQSNAMAAKLVFDAWRFEPLDVEVLLDWTARTVSTTAGRAEVVQASDQAMRIALSNFPLPHKTGKRGSLYREDFACAAYCRIILKVDNAPDGDFSLAEEGDKRKPVMVSGQTLRTGYNLALKGPLTRSQAFKTLFDRIEGKNMGFRNIRSFRQRFIENPTVEPELKMSYETHLLALRQYFEGMVKVQQRTPRTLDITIDLFRAPTRTGR